MTSSLPLLRKLRNASPLVRYLPTGSLLPFPTGRTIPRRNQHNQPPNKPTRGPSAHDVAFFRSVLSRPERSVLSNLPAQSEEDAEEKTKDDDDDGDDIDPLSRYNRDWTGRYRGSSSVVLRPRTASEVSEILRHCHDERIGVVPHGGNTGLCGGATPTAGGGRRQDNCEEVVLSLERMNEIHHLDEDSGILTCDAGCVLQDLHERANDGGFLFPLDIGAKGSCQIGGNVSTNAGGQYFFRFGGLHGTVAGLEAVLPNGTTMRFNMQVETNQDGDGVEVDTVIPKSTHRKDNTGYDLKHLFIGAEGTLGVVTKVAVACPSLPSAKNAALLVCDSYDQVLRILHAAKEELGEILSAVEFMDYNTLQMVREHGFGGGGENDDGDDDSDAGSRLLRDMLRSNNQPSLRPSFLLVETQGSNADHDASKMDSFLTRLHDDDLIVNGFLSQNAEQTAGMWRIRESCNPSVARAGCVYKFDVSIPIEDYLDVAREAERELTSGSNYDGDDAETTGTAEERGAAPPDLTLCVWGHVADGNAHVNAVTPGRHEWDPVLAERIETAVYDAVLRRRGSISAEHGLGQSKNEYLTRIKEESELDAMRQIKTLFDPHGIMNPGKYLPTVK